MIKDLDLSQLNEYVKLPVGEAIPLGVGEAIPLGVGEAIPLGIAGYIKKGDLNIEIGKVISLKGDLESKELKFASENINLGGDIKLLGYLKILEEELDYHINYQIKNGYFSGLKNFKEIQAKGFLKKNELFLSRAELTYKNLIVETAGWIKDFSSPKIDLKFSGKPGTLTIKTQYNKKSGKMEINCLAEVWRGKFKLNGALDLFGKKGNLNATADNIDIGQAIQELNVGGRTPRGKLSLEINLTSFDLFKWKNLLGEGKILISEGDIYQINFLKGLGKFLSIPGFENIVFKRAYSDLFFQGQEIFFENFQLNAAQMDIEGKGKITTAGNIDFLLFPQFSQELIDSSKGLQKYLTALLGEGNFSVGISGTIKNPVYTTNISLIPSLDKIKDIKDIFGDFLDW